MNHPNALAAKVAAVNRANTEANRLFPILAAALAPFVGQKVLRADNTLTEKVRKVIAPLYPAQTPGLQVFADTGGGYSLRVNVKTFESVAGGGGCSYHETGLHLGSISGGILAPWNGSTQEARRTDYSAAEVARLREVAETAREAARQAENACFPFGLFER